MPTTTYSDPAGGFESLAIKGRTTPAGAALVDTTVEAMRALVWVLYTEGVLYDVGSPNPFAVLQDTGTNMNIKVGSNTSKADMAIVYGDDAGQGAYLVRANDGTHTLTVPAAHATLSRLDEVYLVVRDTTYDASGIGTVRYGYRQGDASATPVAPGPDAAWDAELALARISVPPADTQITTSQITSLRVASALRGVDVSLETAVHYENVNFTMPGGTGMRNAFFLSGAATPPGWAGYYADITVHLHLSADANTWKLETLFSGMGVTRSADDLGVFFDNTDSDTLNGGSQGAGTLWSTMASGGHATGLVTYTLHRRP